MSSRDKPNPKSPKGSRPTSPGATDREFDLTPPPSLSEPQKQLLKANKPPPPTRPPTVGQTATLTRSDTNHSMNSNHSGGEGLEVDSFPKPINRRNATKLTQFFGVTGEELEEASLRTQLYLTVLVASATMDSFSDSAVSSPFSTPSTSNPNLLTGENSPNSTTPAPPSPAAGIAITVVPPPAPEPVIVSPPTGRTPWDKLVEALEEDDDQFETDLFDLSHSATLPVGLKQKPSAHKRSKSSTAEVSRMRAMKLADFFGVERSEGEVQELRRLLHTPSNSIVNNPNINLTTSPPTSPPPAINKPPSKMMIKSMSDSSVEDSRDRSGSQASNATTVSSIILPSSSSSERERSLSDVSKKRELLPAVPPPPSVPPPDDLEGIVIPEKRERKNSFGRILGFLQTLASGESDSRGSISASISAERSSDASSFKHKRSPSAGSSMQTQWGKSRQRTPSSGSTIIENSAQLREDVNIEAVAKHFRAEMRLATKRYRFRTFENCFTGREAVDWLEEHSVESTRVTRAEAVAIGQELLNRGVIEHVLSQHSFQDKLFLYRFVAHQAEEEVIVREISNASYVPDLTSDVPVNIVQKQGFLELRDKSTGEWKRVWVVLEKSQLSVTSLDDKTETAINDHYTSAQEKVLQLTLQGARVVLDTNGAAHGRPFAFELNAKLASKAVKESVSFASPSLEERERWINAIKIASHIMFGTEVVYDVSHDLLELSSDPKYRPRTLDDFEFVKVLGKGTSGKVILCTEKETRKIYAMKILKKKDLIGPRHLAGAKVESRLLRELSHPYIVRLHFAFQSSDRLYFVMDYLAGGELFYHICEEGAFSEDRGRFYAAEMLLALRYLHSRGIIYRDLKLENVMMGPDGHIKITDFGMCKVDLGNGVRTNSLVGTSEYLPPEILMRTSYSFSVDWWTFGIVLFEMLCGEHPFYSEDKETLYKNILMKRIEYPERLSAEARSVLAGLLIRDAEKRLGCSEVLSEDGSAIANHPFFASIDFAKLERMEIQPPYLPPQDLNAEAKLFDPEFTEAPAVLTPTGSAPVTLPDAFNSFTFVNTPLLRAMTD